MFMLDQGSSLPILVAVGVPRENIIRQLIEVSRFGGCTYTMDFVNLDLTVESSRAEHRFHVIDSQTTYHLMLGRP